MDADAIRRELETARAEARRLAAEQQAWRREVTELFERAVAAGMPVAEVVETLGLSARWASHLLEDARRRELFFGAP